MNITVQQLKQRMDNGEYPRIIDVREPHECNSTGVIAGAQNIPLDQLRKCSANEFNPSSQYVVVCQSGGRSAVAVSVFYQLGIKNTFSLSGGIMAWKQAGYQTIAGAN